MEAQYVVVRKYHSDDFQNILEIYDLVTPEAHGFLGDEILNVQRKLAIETLIKYPDGTWVAELNGQIVGCVSMVDKEKLAGLFVSPLHQRQGIATTLLQHVQEFSSKLELAVYPQNVNAIACYRKNGFSVVKESEDNGHKFSIMAWEKNQESMISTVKERRISKSKPRGFGKAQ